ncbi:MAG: Na+/H+ antiporter NhaA [Gammaproteobacteria bacterium]
MDDDADARLPPEMADRFTEPFARFLKIKAASGGLLLLAACVALVVSNSAWSAPFLAFWDTPLGLRFGSLDFSRSLRHWVNEGLMTLFFLAVALELKRSFSLGELRNLHVAALSLAGALGGMLVPAGLYLLLLDGQPGMSGWGTVVATDTAFVVGSLALLGARVPPGLHLFLLSLAIFDDVGAILIVAAVGYGDPLNWSALAGALLGVAAVAGVARTGVRNAAVYLLLGLAIWLCMDASGIHPTVTGIVLGLMASTRGWVSDRRLHAILARVLAYPHGDHWGGGTADSGDLRRAAIAATEALSPEERLETALHPWVGFAVVPIFALANAGIVVSGTDFRQPLVLAIIGGLVLGKPIGVLAFSWLAVRLGVARRPSGLSWRQLSAGALLTGIGFTMSLFIAGVAYAPAMFNAAKLGILSGSLCSATAGILMLAWLASQRRGA